MKPWRLRITRPVRQKRTGALWQNRSGKIGGRLHVKGNQVRRRQFLRTSGVAIAGLAAGSPLVAGESTGSASSSRRAGRLQDRLVLSTPITHCDWMLKENRPGVVWGAEGVRHMLTICKEAGISHVYW